MTARDEESESGRAETDKSLAYRLALRDDERTLTDAELDDAVARVVRGLTDDLGARFRT